MPCRLDDLLARCPDKDYTRLQEERRLIFGYSISISQFLANNKLRIRNYIDGGVNKVARRKESRDVTGNERTLHKKVTLTEHYSN